MQNVRYEGSLLASLEELKKIEADRVAEEQAAVARAAEAKRLAHEAALQKARDEAEAKVRAEHEAKLAIERARVEAEREARLRVEAAEAAERARALVELEKARVEGERELKLAEVAKKRPRWMVACTFVALAAGAIIGYIANEARSTTQQTEQSTQTFTNATNDAKGAITHDKTSLDGDKGTLTNIGSTTAAKIGELEQRMKATEAKAIADKKAKDAADDLARKQAEWKRQQQIEHDKRVEVIKIDERCLKNSLAKGCGTN